MHPLVYKARRKWYDVWGWPGEIRAAQPEDEGQRRPTPGEIGVTGLKASSGRIAEDYNQDLRTLNDRMNRYEEMRRSDSALAVMEALISLPIRAAKWRIVPGDDKDLADRIQQNLFEEMTHSWDDLLRQALLSVLYGFTVHEKVFEKKSDGFLGWRKFAERDRRTVYSWNFDETGGLNGFHQRGINPKTGTWQDAELPIEKLIIWTWRGEAGNPEGLGAFRQAYKHYFYKTAFEEWAAIRIERQACGIPWIKMSPDCVDPEKETMLQVLRRLRTNETAGVVIPYEWGDLESFEIGAADVPFESHIEREHQYMLQSVLGQFVGYAQGGDSGSWALSRDSSSIFLMSLNSTSKWITECFNRYALAQICYFNERKPGKLPKLECGPVGVRDMDKFVSAIRALFGPNTVIPEDVEGYVREMIDLPEMKPGDYEKRLEAAKPTPPAAKQPTLPGAEPVPTEK